ncbi:MAG TPA: glycosyltransferase family 39 protein [Bacteroidia bacterium]|nr:glycosyltransferase family 39 protein [Bacteroidia bacterium]
MTLRPKIPNLFSYLLLIPAAILFILRAKNISLTWDESYTFFEFVRSPHWLPQDYNYMAANDHLLNTWLMKVSVFLFGEGEFALRLPNVIAGIIFLISLLSFLGKILREQWAVILSFLIIAFNPYLVDFFTIARGYGIALACMMIALNCSVDFIKQQQWNKLFRAQFFFILSTLAVITFIHVFIGAMIFFFFFVIVRIPRQRLWRNMLSLFCIPFLFALLIIPYLIRLKSAGAFFLGQEIKNPLLLFGSLADATVYSTGIMHIIPSLLGKLLLTVPLLAIVIVLLGKQKSDPGIFSFLSITAVFSILLPVLLHYTIGTNLITGRAAIFCLPVLLLLLIMFLANAGKIERGVLILLALLSVVNSSYRMNTRSYFDWSEQADIKSAMKILRDQKVKVEQPYYADIISTDLPYDMPINYYRMRFGMTEFSHAERGEFLRSCGYYYLPVEDTAFYAMADIIHYFPETKTALFRLMDPLPPHYSTVAEEWFDFEALKDFDELKTDTMFFGDKGTWCQYPEHQFTMTLILPVPDSVRNKDLAATLSCRIRTETKKTGALLVFNAKTEHGDSWKAMHISELPEKPGEWSLTGWTRTIPKGTKEIKVYIWNRDKAPVYMDNVSIRLLAKE